MVIVMHIYICLMRMRIRLNIPFKLCLIIILEILKAIYQLVIANLHFMKI